MLKRDIDRALYYLNNRHRLTMADVPNYIEALRLAEQFCFVLDRGRWYPPETKESA
jgi:hypothetical protein